MKMSQLLTIVILGTLILTACGRPQKEDPSAQGANKNIPSNTEDFYLDDKLNPIELEENRENDDNQIEKDENIESDIIGMKDYSQEDIYNDREANLPKKS